jgi:hypothetical protein
MVRDGGVVWSSAGSQHVNRQPGKMLLKICYRNIEIERMNTYIIFKSKQHHQCYAASLARQFGCLIITPQLTCW